MRNKINGIYLKDTLKALPEIESDSFDLAIIDPPYNLSKGTNIKWDNSIKLSGFGGNWEKVMQDWDSMPMFKYFQLCITWLTEIKRIVKDTGSVWIHGTYHNIGIINFALQLLEIEIINEVVWYKRNSFPNLACRRLTASHETILWAHTGKKRKYLFNYDQIKAMNFPEDSLHKPGKQMRTVWDIPNNKNKDEILFGTHPTQKPIRLINRLLAISGKKGNKCLIPFGGSGSECVACINKDIQYLAFENNPEYLSMAKKRIKHAQKNKDNELDLNI